MANQIAGTQVDVDLTLQKADLTAKDLTAATLTWRLTRDYAVPGVLKKTTADDITITNASGGLATVALAVADTLDLQGTYYHEVKADYGSGVEVTWQLGTIVFSESSVAGD